MTLHLPPPQLPDDVTPLDAYLDGMLNPEQAAAFEAVLADDPQLRSALALQREINARMEQFFRPEPAVPARAAHPHPWRRIGWLGAIAAAVVIASAGVYLYTEYHRLNAMKFRSPGDYYTDVSKAGWKPMWVCEDDQKFADAVNFYLGSAVVVPLATPGVEILGWNFADDVRKGTPMSQQTLGLLTRVDGRNVMVLMDRLKADRAMRGDRAAGLNIFRREVNGLVLYEVTPLPQPRVLPHAVPATPSPKLDKGQVKILRDEGKLGPDAKQAPPDVKPPR